jgi:hypothetical protein
MKDRKAMAEALARTSGRGAAKTNTPAPAQEAQPAAATAIEPPRDPHYRPGRATKTNVTGYFPPEVKKQLRLMAAENDSTIQRLMAEALNDLFVKYGKPQVAPLDD